MMIYDQNIPIESIRLLDQCCSVMTREVRKLQDIPGVKCEQVDHVDSISLALYDLGRHIDALYTDR